MIPEMYCGKKLGYTGSTAHLMCSCCVMILAPVTVFFLKMLSFMVKIYRQHLLISICQKQYFQKKSDLNRVTLITRILGFAVCPFGDHFAITRVIWHLVYSVSLFSLTSMVSWTWIINHKRQYLQNYIFLFFF